MLRGVSGARLPSAVSPYQKMERRYTLRTSAWEFQKDLRKMLRTFCGRAGLNQPLSAARSPQWKTTTVICDMKLG